MKRSYYDVLQVSPKASPSVIEAAYQHLRADIEQSIEKGNAEARGDLLILDESYKVLVDAQKRALYDQSLNDFDLRGQTLSTKRQILDEPDDYAADDQGTLMHWWNNRRMTLFFLLVSVFAMLFAIYKFSGQSGSQKIQSRDVQGKVETNQYRAESERKLIEGTLENQDKLIDKSHDVVSRQIESRERSEQRRLDSLREQQERALRASEERRLAYEAQREKMDKEYRIRREEYENKRQATENVKSMKRELCNIYRSEGRRAEAIAAGC